MLAVDPGYGFGKSVMHNLQLVNWVSMLHMLGVPILIGASRKSSIAKLSAGEGADHRLPGSLALGMAALRQGAQMLRVHDVAETAQAVAVEMALAETY
jgi:dihydropteroate synthase